jgi:UPF0755 protein
LKKFLLVMLAVLLVGALAGGAYYWQRQRHLDSFAQAPFGAGPAKVVLIPPKTGPHPLAKLLAANEVIASADDFFAWVRREKVAPKLKAGEYQFDLPITPAQVVAKLASGQQLQYHFTVPEGLRVDEILPILANSELHLHQDKLEALAKDRAFIKKAGVPADSLEGFLYPDTYSFTHGFTEETVLAKMVSRALEEYKKADGQRKAGNNLDLLQAMTLASIVEKETGQPDERPRIACVFHNRLRVKMKLQTDPTVLYAMMLIRGKFIKNITSQDLLTEHPYNTYTTYGLPPGPIASAGAAAIQAALSPMDCNDLYFVSRNNGTHEFCPTLTCHNAAVQKWQKDFFQKPKVQVASANTGKGKPQKSKRRH